MCVVNSDGPLQPCFDEGRLIESLNQLLRQWNLEAHFGLSVLSSDYHKLHSVELKRLQMLLEEVPDILLKVFV
jgi:hypothetical protein